MGRREFLRAGSLPLLGLGLPQLLQARESATTRKGKAKACIVLFMWGGPAQQDTWDMKPDSPVEYRGEFKPIATKVPGIQVCEHLPKLAMRMDKLAQIRSMTHNDVDHTSATHFMLTGRDRANPHRAHQRRLAQLWRDAFVFGKGQGAFAAVCLDDARGA